jgi:hypothetical protein
VAGEGAPGEAEVVFEHIGQMRRGGDSIKKCRLEV